MQKNHYILLFTMIIFILLLVPTIDDVIWRIEGSQIRKAASSYGVEANLWRSGEISCPQVKDDGFDFFKDSKPAFSCTKDDDCVLLRTDEGWSGLAYRAVNCGYAERAINFYSHLMIETASDQSREKYRYWAKHIPTAVCTKSVCEVKTTALQ